MEPGGSLPYSQKPNNGPCPEPNIRPCVTCRNKLAFYGEELLAPRPTPKQDNPFSAVCDCLFNIFAL